MAHHDKEAEAEPLYSRSEDDLVQEFVTSNRKRFSLSQHSYILIAAYLLLAVLYGILWIQFIKLRSGAVAGEHDLFPSMHLTASPFRS